MVGIVIVSHSAQVAEGAVELAREMAGPGASIVTAQAAWTSPAGRLGPTRRW